MTHRDRVLRKCWWDYQHGHITRGELIEQMWALSFAPTAELMAMPVVMR